MTDVAWTIILSMNLSFGLLSFSFQSGPRICSHWMYCAYMKMSTCLPCWNMYHEGIYLGHTHYTCTMPLTRIWRVCFSGKIRSSVVTQLTKPLQVLSLLSPYLCPYLLNFFVCNCLYVFISMLCYFQHLCPSLACAASELNPGIVRLRNSARILVLGPQRSSTIIYTMEC